MKNIIISIFLALALVFIAISCANDGKLDPAEVLDGNGDIGVAVLPIYNGYAPDSPEHSAVISLHKLAGTSVYVQPFCSGTLITPDVIVTAAHCLDVAKQGASTFKTMSPSALAIYVGDNPAIDITSHLYSVSQTIIYPTYNRKTIRNDIALVRLAGPVTEAVTVVENLPPEIGFSTADVGSELNFAGFGQTETGSSGVKLQMDLPLGSLGCLISGCPNTGVEATQIAYAQQSGGPCFGDSGGPAFVYRSGVPYLGGLTSYGDSKCAVYGVSTRVDAFYLWIEAFANPPDCSANGVCNTQCSTGADPDCGPYCGNAICESGESCDGRNGTISCLKDCPGSKKKPTYCYINGVCTGLGCP